MIHLKDRVPLAFWHATGAESSTALCGRTVVLPATRKWVPELLTIGNSMGKNGYIRILSSYGTQKGA